MSSGQHHAGMTKGIASGITLGAISAYFLTPLEISFMAVGCLFGLFLGPDLDHDMATTNEKYVQMVSGRAGLWVWSLIWTPYKIGLKHRSFWSHTPIISTVVRLIYCLFPVIIIPLKDQSSTSFFELIPKTIIAQIVAIPFVVLFFTIIYFLYTETYVDLMTISLSLFTGLVVSDVGHWILDI